MILNLNEGEYFGKRVKALENSLVKLSITSNEADSRTVKHYHTNDYLCIQVAGDYIEKYKNQVLPIHTGDIVFRPCAYPHQNFFSPHGGISFNIEFKNQELENQEVIGMLPQSFAHYKAGVFPSLYQLLYHFQNGSDEDFVQELIYNWLSDITQKPKNSRPLPGVNKVIKIIAQEDEIFHSLASLAARVFLHPAYLARAFKTETGLTISEYQLKQKTESAMRLLLRTSNSIGEIAFRFGFYDDAHFIRSFKSVYGVSPLRFRRTIKS